MRILHMSIFPNAQLARRRRFWNRRELAMVRAMQLPMSRRGVKLVALCPRDHRNLYEAYCQLSRDLVRRGEGPRWDAALLSSWWSWGAHRMVDTAITRTADLGGSHWLEAKCRNTMRAMLWRESNPSRRRVGRGILGLSAMRVASLTCLGKRWSKTRQEQGFVQTRLTTISAKRAPRGRWMIGETP